MRTRYQMLSSSSLRGTKNGFELAFSRNLSLLWNESNSLQFSQRRGNAVVSGNWLLSEIGEQGSRWGSLSKC